MFLLFSKAVWSKTCFSLLISITLVLTRKCEDKCREYSNLVYENEESPVLQMNTVFRRTSHCSIAMTPLIVGGSRAAHAEFPHMAAIGYGTGNVSWQCGGSIISESYILTAAHCLESYDKGPAAKIRAGTINLAEPDSTMQERNVIERIKHPSYKLPMKYNDIALLKLDEPLAVNALVRPACLEINHEPPVKSVIASGFGITGYGDSSISNELMKVQLDLISEGICNTTFAVDFGGRMMPNGLIKSQFCAGVLAGGKDTCQGDSGGPLQRVLEEPYCMYSVVGVTSFGKFCGFKNTPAIYTRVSSYLDWIEDIVWPEG